MIFDPITQILQNEEFNLNAAVAAAVGVGQILMLWYGIHRMNQNNKERTAEAREEAERREKRHVEVMTSLAQEREQSQVMIRALQTLIERTAPPPHETTPLVVLAR